ncbi:CBS domain-containing protein [Flaviaesturariibacter flavus]|uniref:CBS domain-containing protein n=1 Tax=Flaviaesturariibacter flavus TaxID=2502780 RepID=A0A4R1BBZ5_9BACT|nr:chloride channel protein [Flaviaesturariibacter flavus]TCJ14551.1 CBS domain-containing protein [Flaviaesturariibacter flavus]
MHSDLSIPLSPALEENAPGPALFSPDKKRLLYVSALAVFLGACVSLIAKVLVLLIDLITNLAFFGRLSLHPASPAEHHYGGWVVVVPVVGGLIVGLMARYGSRAIRGHGIPEAMEQVLTNKSRIRPSITYLKPLSSAVSIGTGGPFGAEGPIIATGGALGSTLGQILKISSLERKTLLAAGATAGMSAIFGSPVAAIFLAIELLLFEFSPRSIIPVALACITGAAGHHLFFEAGPVFAMTAVSAPSNEAIAAYSAIGLVIGVAAAAITKLVYFIEDAFEHLPVHWALWPAIGGLAVGVVGYFAPHTLGVGYDNIQNLLSGHMALAVVINLCVMKLISWSVALGSGTSGGTLAPLLTIGGATGVLLGMALQSLFPSAGVLLPLAALIGMSAMFAGASRALLTSILFALETTGQGGALLPLLAACLGAYLVSFFLMKNTIMTEKIARRGVRTPQSYHPDLLEKLSVATVAQSGGGILQSDWSLEEARAQLQRESKDHNYYILVGKEGHFDGIVSRSNILSLHHQPGQTTASLVKRRPVAVTADDSLRTAVEAMARENIDVVPVVTPDTRRVTGILSYLDVLAAYRHSLEEQEEVVTISLRGKAGKWLGRR